jgi:hypothetical protein
VDRQKEIGKKSLIQLMSSKGQNSDP